MGARIRNNGRTRNEGYADQSASLDIRELRRLGLLEEGVVKTYSRSEHPEHQIVSALHWSGQGYVQLRTPRTSVTVGLVGRPAPLGGRRWFFLDERKRAREILYLKGGRLVSREEARLNHRSKSRGSIDTLIATRDKVESQLRGSVFKGPARGRHREQLLQQKADIEEVLGIEPD